MWRVSGRWNLAGSVLFKGRWLDRKYRWKNWNAPPTGTELTLETHVLERAVGTKELLKIEKINFDETLLLHVGAAVNLGKVTSVKNNIIKVKLSRPICVQASSRVAISRKITARWRLIGYGIML